MDWQLWVPVIVVSGVVAVGWLFSSGRIPRHAGPPRRHRFWPAVVIAVAAAFAGGCDSSSPPSDQPASAEVSKATEPVDQAKGDAPERGTCWQMPPDKASDPDYWFDDSPVVACTEPHTTETAEVIEIDQPSVSTAKENYDLCWEYVRSYLGISRDTWVPWNYGPVLPSKEQIADGASWLRCDVILPADWASTSVREVSYSTENGVVEHDDDLWGCLNEAPEVQEQPLVSCSEPHRYEETGKLAFILDVDTYPSPRQLREAAARCADLTPEQQSRGTDTTVVWPGKENFTSPQGEFDGACFMYRSDGELLKPRP